MSDCLELLQYRAGMTLNMGYYGGRLRSRSESRSQTDGTGIQSLDRFSRRRDPTGGSQSRHRELPPIQTNGHQVVPPVVDAQVEEDAVSARLWKMGEAGHIQKQPAHRQAVCSMFHGIE